MKTRIFSFSRVQWTEIGCLLNFIGHEIAASSLPDDTNLLQRVLNYVKMEQIDNESARQHSDREQSWLALLTADRINTMTLNDHLTVARRAKCFRVVEHLLIQQKSYDQILDCYLCDERRHNEIWMYLDKYANRAERMIFEQCLRHFEQLLSIDSNKITLFMIECFPKEIDRLIRQLDENTSLQYAYLRDLLKYFVRLSAEDSELYLNLLCRFNVDAVAEFLRTNKDYRIERAIEIVNRHDLIDNVIYLHERNGDFDAAFNLSIGLLKQTANNEAERRAIELSALCSRASDVLSITDCERFWFELIRMILARSDMNAVTRSVLHAASNHCDLTNLVQLVLNSGTMTGNFGDIKHLIVGMLANSKYEILLQETTAKILGTDLHRMFANEKRMSNRGLSVKSVKCIVCRSGLYHQSAALVFGACGHACHQDCMVSFDRDEDDKAKQKCPRCDSEASDNEPIELAQPNDHLFKTHTNDTYNFALQLEAPTRYIL